MENLHPKAGSFSKGRLEAFSDGVFAIAITLLVLEISVHPGDSPLQEFLSAWPAYIGYVLSFITIGIAWIGHSAITEELVEVDAVFLRLNLLLLLVVGFLPFPTKLVTEGFGDSEAERVAVTVYGCTLLAIRGMGMILDRYATAEGLFRADVQDEELTRTRSSSVTGVLLYAIAIVTGLLLPRIAVGIYLAIAVYLAIPWRDLPRLIGHRPAASP